MGATEGVRKSAMRKWLRPALSVVALFTLAFTARWWLPKLLEFAGANANTIQGLTGLVQLGLWSIVLVTTFFFSVRQRSKHTENATRDKSTDNNNHQIKSVEHLLSLEIQQDCRLLQELLAHNEQELLSDKWESRLSENRSVWRDLPARLSLFENNTDSLQLVQEFYQRVDNIEEDCQKLIALKSQISPLESKPRYGGSGALSFDTMNPPEWASKYLTELDAVALINFKKRYSRKFVKLKEVICNALDFGNQVISKLNA